MHKQEKYEKRVMAMSTGSPSKYKVLFAGKTIETTVTDSASVVEQWVLEILSTYQEEAVIVGLDVEWRPHEISYMSNKSATLQLCIDNKCLIVQLFYIDSIPQLLKDFLADSKFTFVGIEVGDDVKKLRDEYGLDCASHKDIRALAKTIYPGRFRRPGLKDLAMEIAGLRMLKPKHVCMSNWEARVLVQNKLNMGALMRMHPTRSAIC